MRVQELLKLIPEDKLTELSISTKVDYYSKKLQGAVIFKLLLHCILTHKDNSLRTMESAYESIAFKMLNQGNDNTQIRYSSISERLSVINPDYFEQLYEICLRSSKKVIGHESTTLLKFDSTIVSLSSKLIDVGYQLAGDSAQFKQLKFTIGYSDIPESIDFYNQQKYTSENVALKESIFRHRKNDPLHIYVFDRGITSRKTFDELTKKKIPFVSRINPNAKYEKIKANKHFQPAVTPSLEIQSDSWGYLFGDKGRKSAKLIRCIGAIKKENQEPMVFVTNIKSASAQQITELYKRRWEIEVFFKFLKQELNFSHLINRSENGIKVIMYVTMIAAVLLTTYKKLNKLKGYKIPKLKFCQELEGEIVKHFIVLCGGDSKQFDKLFNHSPP